MKTHKVSCLLILISLFISSCSDILFWEDYDERISKKIEISDITKIHTESIFHIELIQDSQEYILATGSHDQLEKLTIHTEGSTSFLRHNYNNIFRNDTPIKLQIHLKNITHIEISAPTNIFTSKLLTTDKLNILVAGKSDLVEMDLYLNCQELYFRVDGDVSGRYQLKGESPKASYVLNGTTNIVASDFKNQQINIVQNGIGEAYIFAEQKITATIYTFGNIYYKGDPEIITKRIQINNQSPTAKLIPINSTK